MQNLLGLRLPETISRGKLWLSGNPSAHIPCRASASKFRANKLTHLGRDKKADIFFKETCYIFIKISLKLFPKEPIDNIFIKTIKMINVRRTWN